MKKLPAKDKRYKTRHWTQNQKLEVVSMYLMTGNMAQTAIATGVPLVTIKLWRTTQWFKDFVLQLQSEDTQKVDANLSRIMEKALKAVEDRIDVGDAQYDQKTGKIVRIPIKASVALKVSTELMTKRDKIRTDVVKQEVDKTIDDRLARLAEEFTKFAHSRMKAIDVEAAEVVEPKSV